MIFIEYGLFVISPSKTGVDDVIRKYLDDGFIEGFAPGKPVFILKDGSRSGLAKKKDIDWEAMEKEALSRVKMEAEAWTSIEFDDEMVEARLKVHRRPTAFIGKDGKWHDEEEDGLESQTHDEHDYNYAWEKALKEASDEDFFSHWDYRI